MRNWTLLTAALLGLSLPGPVPASIYLSVEDLQDEAAPAFKALAEDCPSVALVALEGEDLAAYLRTISEPCFERAFHVSENPSLRDEGPTVFSDRNLQSVLAEIEELSVAYDGTNSAGMLQLWRFVQIAYEYQKFWPEITGVGPFDEETDRAYLAASDAFAASDHFHDPNDEAARILYYYFQAAYTAGFRQSHLAPIKQVLSGFTEERAVTELHAWGAQPWAFITVLRRVRGAFLNHNQEFIEAVARDAEFVEVMLEVTRYDFFFYAPDPHPFNTRIRFLGEVVDILVYLAWVESSRESAITALETVLSEHERLSGAFLVAAKGLEDHVDCQGLNICREVLEGEILLRAVPHIYRFDQGALVFQTSLDLAEVLPLYHGTKAVQAQFHRLVETDDPVGDGTEVFTARIYGNRLDYQVFESYLTGADTWGIHGGGVYSGGEMRSWVRNRPGDATSHGDGIFEETVRHEYAHYLADRFGLLSFGGPWFDEGLAEFLVGSTQTEGVHVRRWPANHIWGSESHLDPAGLFESTYSGDLGGGAFYNYAGLFFHFMHRERRSELLALFDLVRSGDSGAYFEQIGRWRQDAQLAADFRVFLDEQTGQLDQHADIVSTEFVPRGFLTIDSVDEIQSALEEIDGDLDLSCHSVDSELSPRFRCSGRLAAEPGFTGDRGQINEHLNERLDAVLKAALEDEEINNLQDMNCYFADIRGSPPVADLLCEGPLRPANLPASGVDLSMAIIHIPDNPEPEVGVDYLFQVEVDVSYADEASGLAASSYRVLWSANQPIRVVEAFTGSGNRECEIAETDSFTGSAECGDLRYGVLPEVVVLYLVPSREGRLAISVELSSDEFEFEPADNVDSVELTVGPAPIRYAAGLSRLTGNWQRQAAGHPLENPLVVEVTDQHDDPFEGAHVTYAVMAGDEVLSTTTATTDEKGRAAAILTLPPEPGRYTIEAAIEGVEAVATFTVIAEVTPDFDGDGEVGFADFFLLAEAFGGSDPRFDLDDSGEVDFADFFLFAESFGQPARARLLALARDRIGLPDGAGLQNAPNPFNSQTVITWFQPGAGPARLEVFSLTGQRVAVLLEGPQKAGLHRMRWDGRDATGRPLASGVYVYRLATGEVVDTRKLTLLR
ncbi:MAG: collagenase [Gemmatimonadaceae bacterium]|nr:collagenase [Gemmatimonadaceae bacterium]